MDEEMIIRLHVSITSGLHCSDRLRLEAHIKEGKAAAPRNLHQAAGALKLLSDMQARIIHLHDGDYPPMLRELYDPPYLLAVIGELPPPDEPSLAVLGPERPSTGACISAWVFGLEAGYARIPVVSRCTGTCAGALLQGLRRGNGRFFGALTGTSEDLARRADREETRWVADCGGGLVMEITGSDASQEARLNRLVYGLSRGMLLLEAVSGSPILDAADDALDQGRDVLVHRRGASSPWGRGTKKLCEAGAPEVSWLGDIQRLWGYGTESTPRVRYWRSVSQPPPDQADRIHIDGMEGWFERIR